MSRPRQISWEQFQATIWREGQRRAHAVGRNPSVEIFGDAVSGRVGLWVELPSREELPAEIDRLALISSRVATRNGRPHLELATASAALHRQFYQFATAVADRILLEGEDPVPAAVAELRCFDELLAPRAILSTERQIGLIGELLVLGRLIGRLGRAGADAWIGASKEQHDFRTGSDEYEVKTTSGTRRIHRINGLGQLFPSPRMRLALVSVLIEPAGNTRGFSLASLVTATRRQLAGDATRLATFSRLLEGLGWRDKDARHYRRQWRQRRPLAVMPVGRGFPRIGRDDISSLLGPASSRIDEVQYMVNVEGLGVEEGSNGFPAQLEAIRQ